MDDCSGDLHYGPTSLVKLHVNDKVKLCLTKDISGYVYIEDRKSVV